MTDRELTLLERLIETQKDMAQAIQAMAEAQFAIAEALTMPDEIQIVGPSGGEALQ